uniref:Uncharacterized protein n=1 Tax=Anguilla anguilla TaxID=7936 RepID=A0A0E9RD00_ANGAN
MSLCVVHITAVRSGMTSLRRCGNRSPSPNQISPRL